MRIIALIFITVFAIRWETVSLSSSEAAQATDDPLGRLFEAIEAVESGGDSNAVGADGEAGPYQIRPIFVDDANKIVGKRAFSYGDRFSKEKSKEMMRIYWRFYATERRLGRLPTFEDLARIHNGGPNGYKKESTKGY